MIKFDLHITISRLVAIITLVFGFILSYTQKEPSAFIAAATAAGTIIAIKTGIYAYNTSKKSKDKINDES